METRNYSAFKKISKVSLAFFLLLILIGCSHGIQLTPSLDSIREEPLGVKIDKNVGYYISKGDLLKEVTTPGGGGDKVSYKPYVDTQAAMNTILSRVFDKVFFVSDINDHEYISDKNIVFIFKPSIVTDSSSSSSFTWPPTEFVFELTCHAVNSEGKTIWEKTVMGKGNAEYDEFKDDFSLSARRASENAYHKMLIEIVKAEEFIK